MLPNCPANQINVLIVDDDSIICLVLSKLLTKAGCIVSTSETGNGALELLDAQTYDAAIIDVNLQDMNGIDLLNKMPHNITKIVLTGYPTDRDKIRAFEKGANYYLEKPAPSETIVKLVLSSKNFN